MSLAQDLLIFGLGWTHVLLAPYTKVEESFNLHATHDVLFYGVKSLPFYDHFIFPGAVPRTFIGSILLAWMSTPVVFLASRFDLVKDKFDLQIIVRLVLASLNALCLCLVRRAISRRFGRLTGFMFTLFTCTQFHIPFWMGRTLPNFFALMPTNISLYLLVDYAPNSTRPSPANLQAVIVLLTCTTVICRSEVLLLLVPIALLSLIAGSITFTNLLKTGSISGIASLACTTLVDSYFWDSWPLWPEFSSVYFNVVEGKSSEWGISPFHTYFSSFLPKLLLSALPLSALGAVLDSRIRQLLVAPMVFLGLISCLGHKEWRFIVYVVPIFNIAAARGARWLVSRKKGTIFGRLAFLLATGMIAANAAVTLLTTGASIANYPGGEALALFNHKYERASNVHVHISNLAAQSGASLFLQTHCPPYLAFSPSAPSSSQPWTYNKIEDLSTSALSSHGFTHLISEASSLSGWRVVDTVSGFDGWVLDKDVLKTRNWSATSSLLTMRKSEKLWILERKSGGGWI